MLEVIGLGGLLLAIYKLSKVREDMKRNGF